MFSGMNEKEAREKILEYVDEYCDLFHNKEQEFQPGDRIPYAARIYDREEMHNLVDSSLEFWLTSGKYTVQFEKNFSEKLDVKYCSLVNSGSSANLLAFMALTSPLLKERQIKKATKLLLLPLDFLQRLHRSYSTGQFRFLLMSRFLNTILMFINWRMLFQRIRKRLC